MGEVYRARDKKLDRDVAIKVLPQSVAADPDTLARFEREAKAVAALSHPNILSIFDFGVQDGVTYAVMELLEGETLRGKLDARPIPQKQAVDYALQVVKGLSAAHEKGIVHRDLKPENLFVSKDGHLKILDFGLAKKVEAVAPGKETSAPTVSGHTEPGTVIGTVGYMSPEQVRGLPVDHRSDIFSFGTILYELLSGEKAFSRATAADTMSAILKEEPPELTQSGRNVSPALDHIVKHCLEKDRGNRFQTAKDIGFNLSEQSSPLVTSGVQPEAAPTGRRKKFIAAAILFGLVIAGDLLLKRSHTSGGEAVGVKRVAVLPFDNLGAPEDDYFADGIADAVRGKLTSLPGLEVIARGSSTPYKKTTKTLQEIARELNARYLLTATVRWQKGGGVASRVEVSPELVEVRASGAPASKWQQPFDAALTDVFRVQSEIATQVARSLGGALDAGEQKRLSDIPTQNVAAYDTFLRGEEVSDSLGSGDPVTLRKALGFYEQAATLDPSFVQAWAAVSRASTLLYANGIPKPELAEQARQAADRAVVLAPNRSEGYFARGSYLRLVLQDFRAALEEYGKGRRLDPGNAALVAAAGRAEASLGDWNTAIEHWRQAERLDPRFADFRWLLGDAFTRLRRYAEAGEALDRGLALAPANLDLIVTKTMAFLAQGNLAEARSTLKAAPKAAQPVSFVSYLGVYAPDLIWLLDGPERELLLRLTPSAFDDDKGNWGLALAGVCALRRETTNVHLYAEEARRALEEQLRVAPGDTGVRSRLGRALAYLGRREEAMREGERAITLMPVARDRYQNGPDVQYELMRIYILVGEPEKALDQLEPLLKIPYVLTPAWLKIDPTFDPLRKNPRFQKLVAGTS